jgi:hypothetical protein
LGTLVFCLPICSHLSFSFSFFFFFTDVLRFSDLSSRCLRVFSVLSLFLCWPHIYSSGHCHFKLSLRSNLLHLIVACISRHASRLAVNSLFLSCFHSF